MEWGTTPETKNIILYIAVIAIVALYACGNRKSNSGFEEQLLDVDVTYTIRGLAALMIIAHHIMNEVGYPVGIRIINWFGYLATGTFFMISGYRNWKFIKKKEGMHPEWLFKRLKALYLVFIPFFVVAVLLILYCNLFWNQRIAITPSSLMIDIIKFSLPNIINWFPKVMVVTLVVFWITNRFISSPMKKIICHAILMSAYILIARELKLQSYWYISCVAFLIGEFVAWKEQEILIKLQRINDKTLLFGSEIAINGILAMLYLVNWQFMISLGLILQCVLIIWMYSFRSVSKPLM